MPKKAGAARGHDGRTVNRARMAADFLAALADPVAKYGEIRVGDDGLPIRGSGRWRSDYVPVTPRNKALLALEYVHELFADVLPPRTQDGDAGLIVAWEKRKADDHEGRLEDVLRQLGAENKDPGNWSRQGIRTDKASVADFLWQRCVSPFDVRTALSLVRDSLGTELTAKHLQSKRVAVLLHDQLGAALKVRAEELAGAFVEEPSTREVEEVIAAVTVGTRTMTVRRAYVNWCELRHGTPVGPRHFSELIGGLPEVFTRTFGRKHVHGWLGLGLRKGVASR